MIPDNLLVAFALLTAPPGAPVPRLTLPLATAIARLALASEILDAREVPYFLRRPGEMNADLDALRARRRELADAPLVEDALRFPSRQTAERLITDVCWPYRHHLELRRDLDVVRRWEWQAAINETSGLYACWDKLRDAQTPYYYVTARRRALKDLRELIGEEAYYAGAMPPPVPLWRFARVP